MDLIPKTKTLKNGLKLVTLNIPQSQSVTALLMIKVGSRYETDKIAGISHFLEHLVFKGTQKYRTAFDLTSTVDAIGAEFNAFTGKEYTGFYVKSASNHLDLALDVLSQLVYYPLLPQKEMEKEKGVIIEEINMYEDNPMAKVGLEYESLLYGKSPLGRETIGYKSSILNMKKQDFLAYCKNWYQPQNMILGIIGGFKNPNLPHIKDHPLYEEEAMGQLDRLVFNQEAPAIRVKYKKTEQSHLCLGLRTFQRGHQDRYVMGVLSTILGGNMSSRLFTEVREKRGLAYYIKSDINTYFDNGYLIVQAGVDNNKAGEAVKVILSVMSNVHAKGRAGKCQMSNVELKRAKEYLKGKLALSMEDSKESASLFVESLLLENKIRTVREIIKGIEKVSSNDIARVAKAIFVNKGLNLALIGPHKDETGFAKGLKIT